MFEISREAPSYGGHFQAQEGGFVVWIADPKDKTLAVRAVRKRLANGRIFASAAQQNAPIAVQKADFSLRQLAAWRDIVVSHGDSLNLVTADLDERRNRVTVGVEPSTIAASAPKIRDQLVALGIPTAALRIAATDRPTPATRREYRTEANTSASLSSTLASYASELVGGLRVRWWESGVSVYNICTIGYTASIAGEGDGFVSASHCSPNRWGNDGSSGVFGQPNESYVVGHERYDPGPGECPLLWGCSSYRFSDANLNLVTNRDVSVGFLAAPTTRNNTIGSDTTLNGFGYTIPVVSTTSSITQGSRIDQIGATTGWLYSDVDDTALTTGLASTDEWSGVCTRHLRRVRKATVEVPCSIM